VVDAKPLGGSRQTLRVRYGLDQTEVVPRQILEWFAHATVLWMQ